MIIPARLKKFISNFKKTDGNDILERSASKTEKLDIPNKSIFEYLYDSIGDDKDFYALNYFDTRITYGELFRNINLIAKSLKYLGVKRGEIVTICMPNTPEAVETFYATNKIGAVADMIHPLSSKREIRNYLRESKSRIVLLHDANYSKMKDIIEDTNVYRVILTSASESMPKFTKTIYNLTRHYEKPPVEDINYLSWKEFLNLGYMYHNEYQTKTNSKALAVILHSGGTTGTPKGIMLDNASFNALAKQGSLNVAKVNPRDKIVTILPIFHGFGLGVCLHCPLTIAVEVILVPEFDPKRFAKILSKNRPQVLAGVPTLWKSMLTDSSFKNLDLSSLKYLISGGDSLSIPLETKINAFLKEHDADIVLSKGYGMTESLAATIFTFPDANIPGSVGLPMLGNSVKICDVQTAREVPPCSEGEICVTGPTLMMGYYNRPDETAKVLKKHSDGKIWLHTGDAGYKDEEGHVFFTTRLKRMIVSSGFNIYPNQIEETIEKHPKVKSCCVVGIPHPYKMHVPKAFVVLNDEATASTKLIAELRLLCKDELSAFSQPKEFEFVQDLPKTIYNKIDYKKLEKEGNLSYEREK